MIRGAGFTDIGQHRNENEDDFLVMEEKHLFLVCDGVGGQKDGAKASHLVTESIRKFAESASPGDAPDEALLKDYFTEVIGNINTYVYDASASHVRQEGMATTLVLAFFAWDNAYIINLGDSRAYLIRGGALSQITWDHTYVNQLLKAGTITPEEAETHPNRHMITRAIGAERTVNPDFFTFPVEKGDRLLLCSDGLYNDVSPEEILALVSESADPSSLAKTLVERANLAGGNDNITAVTVFVD